MADLNVNTMIKEKDKFRLFKSISIVKWTLLNFKTYKGQVIKTVWYWQENRQIDQWNGTDHPEIDSHKYRQLIFDKEIQIIQRKMDALPQIMLKQVDIHMQNSLSTQCPYYFDKN